MSKNVLYYLNGKLIPEHAAYHIVKLNQEFRGYDNRTVEGWWANRDTSPSCRESIMDLTDQWLEVYIQSDDE